MEELTLLTEVRLDGFPYLYASLVVGGHVAYHFLQQEAHAIAEFHLAESWVQTVHYDVGNLIALVLLHESRLAVEVVALAQLLVDALDGTCALALLLHLQANLWCLVFGEQEFGEVDVAVGSLQVLQFEAHHLYLLHQFVVVGIEGIEHIHRVVVLLVGGGVVEREEGIEGFEGGLRGVASHLLRLVEDDDRVVCGKHGDWFAGAELISLAIYYTGCLVFCSFFYCVESLSVDNHHANVVRLREGIDVVETAAVINKITCLFAVLLHEVVYGDVETLLHSFADGYTRYDYDKFCPTIMLVQFKHGLDIDVGLSCSCFHLHVELAGAKLAAEFFVQVDIVLCLHLVDVVEERQSIDNETVVLIPQAVVVIGEGGLHHLAVVCLAIHDIHLSLVHSIRQVGLVGLSLKHVHHAIDGIGLVLLYLKL